MAPINPIKTALLSYGMSGRVFHAPFLAALPEYELYGVLERTKNEAAKEYPAIKVFRTLEEVLENNEIELVIVNTPNTTHYELARRSLEAGKHVLVEKPFTTRVSEAEDLIRLATAKQKVLSVYHNRRFDSDYRTIKSILRQNLLGEIVEAEFHFDRFRAELSSKAHKETAVFGTGALFDLGSHLIDQALQLFGLPEKLFADIRTVRPGSVVDDYFELLLYYPSLRVRLHCSYLVREELPGYIIHGRNGSFIKSKTNIQEDALQKGIIPGSENWGVEPASEQGLLHTQLDGIVVKKLVQSERGDYADYFRELYSAIRDDNKPPVSPEDAMHVIKIIEAAFESSEKGTTVEIR